MSTSSEHHWLSSKYLNILSTFSKLDLYNFTETDRRRFDFSCLIERDYRRPLVGQTLWKHREGIDKDIRTLVVMEDADIWAYVARDNLKNRALLYEVVNDFRQSKYRDQLYKLKLFWIPHDFEAGNPIAEEIVENIFKNKIVNDILFNIVFGRLTGEDIRFFLNITGIPGVNLHILYNIALNGFNGFSDLSKGISTNITTVRERYQTVLGSGFIYETARDAKIGRRERASGYASLKGRVFLNLLHLIYEAYQSNIFRPLRCFMWVSGNPAYQR